MSAVPAVLLHPLASTPAQHLRPKEVGHEGTGRACAPWLIARGRSLDVPRLDWVALHHSSFGSDAASARFATILNSESRIHRIGKHAPENPRSSSGARLIASYGATENPRSTRPSNFP